MMADRKPNGRSSIYLGQDGYWHGWVTVGIKPDGSPDRRHRMGKTEAEVTRKVRELDGKRETGQVAKPGKVPTVAEWMTEYLDVICDRLVASGKMAPRALEDYRSKTRHWIIPLLGRHRLDRLAPEHLDKAYATMLEQGRSSSTVLKVHRILSRALKIAVRRSKVTRNVATLVDAPVAADPDLEPLTRNEACKILEAAKSRQKRGPLVGGSCPRHPPGRSARPPVVLRRPRNGRDQSLVPGTAIAVEARLRGPSRVREWHRWPCKPRCQRTLDSDPQRFREL